MSNFPLNISAISTRSSYKNIHCIEWGPNNHIATATNEIVNIYKKEKDKFLFSFQISRHKSAITALRWNIPSIEISQYERSSFQYLLAVGDENGNCLIYDTNTGKRYAGISPEQKVNNLMISDIRWCPKQSSSIIFILASVSTSDQAASPSTSNVPSSSGIDKITTPLVSNANSILLCFEVGSSSRRRNSSVEICGEGIPFQSVNLVMKFHVKFKVRFDSISCDSIKFMRLILSNSLNSTFVDMKISDSFDLESISNLRQISPPIQTPPRTFSIQTPNLQSPSKSKTPFIQYAHDIDIAESYDRDLVKSASIEIKNFHMQRMLTCEFLPFDEDRLVVIYPSTICIYNMKTRITSHLLTESMQDFSIIHNIFRFISPTSFIVTTCGGFIYRFDLIEDRWVRCKESDISLSSRIAASTLNPFSETNEIALLLTNGSIVIFSEVVQTIQIRKEVDGHPIKLASGFYQVDNIQKTKFVCTNIIPCLPDTIDTYFSHYDQIAVATNQGYIGIFSNDSLMLKFQIDVNLEKQNKKERRLSSASLTSMASQNTFESNDSTFSSTFALLRNISLYSSVNQNKQVIDSIYFLTPTRLVIGASQLYLIDIARRKLVVPLFNKNPIIPNKLIARDGIVAFCQIPNVVNFMTNDQLYGQRNRCIHKAAFFNEPIAFCVPNDDDHNLWLTVLTNGDIYVLNLDAYSDNASSNDHSSSSIQEKQKITFNEYLGDITGAAFSCRTIYLISSRSTVLSVHIDTKITNSFHFSEYGLTGIKMHQNYLLIVDTALNCGLIKIDQVKAKLKSNLNSESFLLVHKFELIKVCPFKLLHESSIQFFDLNHVVIETSKTLLKIYKIPSFNVIMKELDQSPFPIDRKTILLANSFNQIVNYAEQSGDISIVQFLRILNNYHTADLFYSNSSNYHFQNNSSSCNDNSNTVSENLKLLNLPLNTGFSVCAGQFMNAYHSVVVTEMETHFMQFVEYLILTGRNKDAADILLYGKSNFLKLQKLKRQLNKKKHSRKSTPELINELEKRIEMEEKLMSQNIFADFSSILLANAILGPNELSISTILQKVNKKGHETLFAQFLVLLGKYDQGIAMIQELNDFFLTIKYSKLIYGQSEAHQDQIKQFGYQLLTSSTADVVFLSNIELIALLIGDFHAALFFLHHKMQLTKAYALLKFIDENNLNVVDSSIAKFYQFGSFESIKKNVLDQWEKEISQMTTINEDIQS